MTRARENADGARLDAALASPDFTGNVDITGNAPVLKLATNTNATNAEIQLHARSSDGNPSANKVHLKSVALGSDEATRFACEVMSAADGTMTERLSVRNNGNVGIGTNSPVGRLHIQQSAVGGADAHADRNGLIIEEAGSNTGMTIKSDTNMEGQVVFSDTSEYRGGMKYSHTTDYLTFFSAASDQVRITNTGTINGNGNFVDSQFDFAEYFEWADGNPDDEYRAGESVILVEGKIRIATASDDVEDIIGVISETSAFVGNAADFEWHKKYATDDFGKKEYVEVDGEMKPKLNPDYDETQTYVERVKRKEWVIVGLLGQIAIKKASPKKSNWKKIRDVSDTVEQWLIS